MVISLSNKNDLFIKSNYKYVIKDQSGKQQSFIIKDKAHLFNFTEENITDLFKKFKESDKVNNASARANLSEDLGRSTLYINDELLTTNVLPNSQNTALYYKFEAKLSKINIKNHSIIIFFEKYFHQQALLEGWTIFLVNYFATLTPTEILDTRDQRAVNKIDFIDESTFVYTCFLPSGIKSPTFYSKNVKTPYSKDLAIIFQCKIHVVSTDVIEVSNASIAIANFNNATDRKLLDYLKCALKKFTDLMEKETKNSLKIRGNLLLNKNYNIKIKDRKDKKHEETFGYTFNFKFNDESHLLYFSQKNIHDLFKTFYIANREQVALDLNRTTLYINQKIFEKYSLTEYEKKFPDNDKLNEYLFIRFVNILKSDCQIYNLNVINFFEDYFHQGALLEGWITFFSEYIIKKYHQRIILSRVAAINMLDFIDNNTFLYTAFNCCSLEDSEAENKNAVRNSKKLAIAFQCKVKIIGADNIEISDASIGIANLDKNNKYDKILLEDLKSAFRDFSQIVQKRMIKDNGQAVNNLTIKTKVEENFWKRYLGTKAF